MRDNTYFYAEEAEQFRFTPIPDELLEAERFEKMSLDAKVLYSVLLKRVNLSIRNNWVDEEGKVYIIYTREEAEKKLRRANQKVVAIFKELKHFDLIDDKKRGLGKPNLIYVRKFINTPQTLENPLKCENHMSGNVKITSQEVCKSHASYKDLSNKKDSLSLGKNLEISKQDFAEDIIERYHDTCTEFPQVRDIDKRRIRGINSLKDDFTRIGMEPISTFQLIFDKMHGNPFFHGKNKINWIGNLDWILEQGKAIRVLEGQYDTHMEETLLEPPSLDSIAEMRRIAGQYGEETI